MYSRKWVLRQLDENPLGVSVPWLQRQRSEGMPWAIAWLAYFFSPQAILDRLEQEEIVYPMRVKPRTTEEYFKRQGCPLIVYRRRLYAADV